MAVRPGDFGDFDTAPDGSEWELFGEVYATNPRKLLDAGSHDMLRLWRMFQGGMAGVGVLPDDGGSGRQAAIMLDAFSVMSAAEAELKQTGE